MVGERNPTSIVILSFLHYIKRRKSSPRIYLHPEIALLEAIVTIYTFIRAQTGVTPKPLFRIEERSGIAFSILSWLGGFESKAFDYRKEAL